MGPPGHDRGAVPRLGLPDRRLRLCLRVTDKGDYDWVECGSCDCGWQVPHYAESVG